MAQFDRQEEETDVVPFPAEMVGGRLRCLISVFKCSAVLFLGVCLQDVEASSCVIHSVIHKKVGDTVVLSSCLPSEGVTVARWRYRGSIIAEKGTVVPEKEQFKGRLEQNATDFSLTLRSLTLNDSGDFSLNSEANDKQQDTVTIKLQVHEPITEQPVLTANSTWNSSTNSCTVLLECSATSDSSVTYNWTVRNQIISGSRLQYVIRQQDRDTNFTCTVYNFLSEKSATTTVECRNDTQIRNIPEAVDFVVLLSLAAGGCLMIVIVVGIVVVVCHSKQRRAGSDSNDLTVYADVTEISTEDGTMKPCSVYETIDNRVYPEKQAPQTVYDKIQLNRVRQPPTSHYQDVS
ncbi:signaling lymphocytic activation molecule-like isoform X2 [Micropterus dolomieu]|uniref:signaling lymphocytic activation molecule-like isoform X2 n=1 Tax=Micropterus dolomieu TaxID=147949 RepID=UPI001E8D2DC5|nr:signaling lymphocytic activation molecule-like isoform X2 [Micropterus dolomieu]